MRTKGLEGEQYFKRFIDDYTKMQQQVFLRENHKHLNALEFIKMVEKNIFENKVSMFR